jgi:Mak10 subunit, NatC N(alpha)-terminal acetyltransferase
MNILEQLKRECQELDVGELRVSKEPHDFSYQEVMSAMELQDAKTDSMLHFADAHVLDEALLCGAVPRFEDVSSQTKALVYDELMHQFMMWLNGYGTLSQTVLTCTYFSPSNIIRQCRSFIDSELAKQANDDENENEKEKEKENEKENDDDGSKTTSIFLLFYVLLFNVRVHLLRANMNDAEDIVLHHFHQFPLNARALLSIGLDRVDELLASAPLLDDGSDGDNGDVLALIRLLIDFFHVSRERGERKLRFITSVRLLAHLSKMHALVDDDDDGGAEQSQSSSASASSAFAASSPARCASASREALLYDSKLFQRKLSYRYEPPLVEYKVCPSPDLGVGVTDYVSYWRTCIGDYQAMMLRAADLYPLRSVPTVLRGFLAPNSRMMLESLKRRLVAEYGIDVDKLPARALTDFVDHFARLMMSLWTANTPRQYRRMCEALSSPGWRMLLKRTEQSSAVPMHLFVGDECTRFKSALIALGFHADMALYQGQERLLAFWYLAHLQRLHIQLREQNPQHLPAAVEPRNIDSFRARHHMLRGMLQCHCLAMVHGHLQPINITEGVFAARYGALQDLRTPPPLKFDFFADSIRVLSAERADELLHSATQELRLAAELEPSYADTVAQPNIDEMRRYADSNYRQAPTFVLPSHEQLIY